MMKAHVRCPTLAAPSSPFELRAGAGCPTLEDSPIALFLSAHQIHISVEIPAPAFLFANLTGMVYNIWWRRPVAWPRPID